MATWNSSVYNNKGPTSGGHGDFQGVHYLHASAALGSTLATNDTINFGYIPNNAIVVDTWLKADSQLDSNGTPTLTFDLGVTGTTQLWKAAISTVGRASGVTSDDTMASAGGLYKNTTGSSQLVIGTVHAGPATGVAGTLEAAIGFIVEDTAGSNP